MMLFGFLDVSQKSIFLAILAAVSTYLQMHFSASIPHKVKNALPSREDFAEIMTKQMKYTMPVIVFFISWKISGVVALYWFVSNVVGILQDKYIKNRISPPLLLNSK